MSDQRTIRAWARANDIPVAAVGMLPAAVVAAYKATPIAVRHPDPGTGEVACPCGRFRVLHLPRARAAAVVQLRVHQAVKHPAPAGVAA